jgi:hypothetical protein
MDTNEGNAQLENLPEKGGAPKNVGDGVYEIELYVGSDVIGFATGNVKIYQEIVR